MCHKGVYANGLYGMGPLWPFGNVVIFGRRRWTLARRKTKDPAKDVPKKASSARGFLVVSPALLVVVFIGWCWLVCRRYGKRVSIGRMR